MPDTENLFVDTKPTDMTAWDLVERLSTNGISVQSVGDYATRFYTVTSPKQTSRRRLI